MTKPIEFATDSEILERMKRDGLDKLLVDMMHGARRMDALSVDMPMPVFFAVLDRLGVEYTMPDEDD